MFKEQTSPTTHLQMKKLRIREALWLIFDLMLRQGRTQTRTSSSHYPFQHYPHYIMLLLNFMAYSEVSVIIINYYFFLLYNSSRKKPHLFLTFICSISVSSSGTPGSIAMIMSSKPLPFSWTREVLDPGSRYRTKRKTKFLKNPIVQELFLASMLLCSKGFSMIFSLSIYM